MTVASEAHARAYGRKAVTLVLENEEIYIMNLVLPAAEKYTLWNLIKDELIMKFGNIDNILFDFALCRKTGKTMEVMVYCINFDMKKIVSEMKRKGGMLKGVYPLQLYILKEYGKLVRKSSYFLAFLFRKRIYLVAIVDKMLVMNKIMPESEGLNEQDFGYLADKIKVIYLLDIPKEAVEVFLPQDMEIKVLKQFRDKIF
jgi:hypothetical protein